MSLRARTLAACLALAACAPDGAEPAGEAESAASSVPPAFAKPLARTNGRACATCHVVDEHTTLRPASVAARLHGSPKDPLFNPLDADDPSAPTLTFGHLSAGLVRVTIPLADNLDLVDAAGHVITNADRTISVWRGVPSVENTAYTAPFQADGREPTLEAQALGALHAHSAVANDPPPSRIAQIAGYERTVFSSPTAAAIGAALAAGQVPDVPPEQGLNPDEIAGRLLFQRACMPCHGGPTQTAFINQDVHDQLFPVLNADGSIDIALLPDGTIVPAAVRHDVTDHFAVNLGIAFGTYLGQIGALPNLTGVDFPRYRVRFYTDATRTKKLVDLPPLPPALAPTGVPQAFSVDPGRAIVTGDVADWEAFDVPQLRGIAQTAPYFHDNSAPDLGAVLDIYSRFILPALPQLGLARVVPPAAPGLPPEALTASQKAQIIAYLKRI